MNVTKTHKIIIGIIILLLVLVGYMVFGRESVDNTNTKTEEKGTLTVGESGELKGVDANGGTYTITPVEIKEEKKSTPIPSLDRPLTTSVGATIAPEAKALAVEKVTAMQTLLKKDTTNLNAWIDLGIYQKMGGDYEGALLSWKYVGAVAQKDYVSLGNIGNLYAYQLKDNAQAEIYYKKAIANGPTQAHLYAQLAEVYRDVLNDADKARAIVAEGLTKLPNNEGLLYLQTSLK